MNVKKNTGAKSKPAKAAGKRALRSRTKKPANPSAAAAATGDKTAAAGLPDMYNAIEALNANVYGETKLRPAKSHDFAGSMNSIVLASSEFADAARDYPIVFSDQQDGCMPFVVTGYASGANVYVGEKGNWREDAYIPAYVRRYPFIFIESEDKKKLTLAVDPSSEMLSQREGNALYDRQGEPTETTKKALAFCQAFNRELEQTAEFCRQIIDMDITVSRTANVNLPGGKKAVVSGFRIVDESKLNELSDKKFLDLRKSGMLALIYCHLMSMRAWKNILE